MFTSVAKIIDLVRLDATFLQVCKIHCMNTETLLLLTFDTNFNVCYRGDIFTPLNMTWHKMKCDWFLYLSVIWPPGRALANESTQSSQTLSRKALTYYVKLTFFSKIIVNSSKYTSLITISHKSKAKIHFLTRNFNSFCICSITDFCLVLTK